MLAMMNMVSSFGMMILTIWVPLKTGTPWFYIGLALFLIGLIGYLIAVRNYATTPDDEPVRKGMYRISRNPLYLFFGVIYFGLIVATLSLPLLIIWMINIVLTHLIILAEEGYCLKTYTESYRDYMQIVPRWFLFF
jgi:protein-S-isoprenylcysteine O-methyltransferase Ste14